MLPLREYKRSEITWFQRMFIRTLKCGPMPQHIAFIMDGNRRYARSVLNAPAIEGHKMGFEKMLQIIDWFEGMDIREGTVYAFSIENFKRSQGEVDGLMQLLRAKLSELLENKEEIVKRGARFQFFGNLSFFPADVQKLLAELALLSKDGRKVCLNVCAGYTSREEMQTAVQELSKGVNQGLIEPKDITEELFDQCLYTSESTPPDLLVRTSGETRLSDFLLWQSSFAVLHFTGVMWPQFNIWSLFWAILVYQRNYKAQQALIMAKDKKIGVYVPEQDTIQRQNTFLEDLQRRRVEKWEVMKNHAIPTDNPQ